MTSVCKKCTAINSPNANACIDCGYSEKSKKRKRNDDDDAKKKKKPVHSFFTNVNKKWVSYPDYKRFTLPNGWKCINQSCVYRNHLQEADHKDSLKIAAFDFDKTLCQHSFRWGNYVFSLPEHICFDNVLEYIQELHKNDYRIVIFTNELTQGKTVDKIKESLMKKITRVETFIDYLKDIPIQVYMACDRDKFRKPATKKRRLHL